MTFEEILTLKKQMQQNITVVSRFLFYVRRQQFFFSNKQMTAFLGNIARFLPVFSEHLEEINGDAPVLDLESLAAVIQELQNAQEVKDYVTLADIMELQILPAFVSVQERLVSAVGIVIDEAVVKENIKWCQERNPQLLYSLLPVELVSEILDAESISDQVLDQLVQIVNQCVEKGIAVEPTSSGYPTMAIQRGEHVFYMHTNGNIIAEAMDLAWEWILQEKDIYTFYGLGMGYPYQEMLLMDHNLSIRVFDTNRESLLLALLFSPLGNLFKTGRFELIYDPTGNKMKHESLYIDEDNGFYIFYPALNGIKKGWLKEQLEGYFVEESSVRTHFRRLNSNFRKNCSVDASGIDALQDQFAEKDVVIVAAGPSLDKNMEILKEKADGVIILAVGTVLKKLLTAGIRPDYVMVIDGYTTVYPQVAGVEDCGVPLIFLSTVYSKIPAAYQAEKYILCQRGFEPAERLAKERGWELVESGGSVATTALDLCLRLKAERIIFVGADLAYTNEAHHASDTMSGADRSLETGIYVDAVDGGQVQTSRNLKSYLNWMEKRLKNRTEEEMVIPVIDATEGGALKKGMRNMTLRDAMSEEG